jgi:alpha-D-ribose 1-methylphosphonate 5-triphosphate synthase subunit PhnG
MTYPYCTRAGILSIRLDKKNDPDRNPLPPRRSASLDGNPGAGGDGEAFNLGEMTVTRCALRLGPHIGHAYIAGRDHAKARLAALLDAALQDSALHDTCMHAVVEPLAAAQREARAAEARKAAATRVDFFTMATMR